MTYGYDSSIVGPEQSDARMIDYRRNFIEQLETSRTSAKVCKSLCMLIETCSMTLAVRIRTGLSYSLATAWEAF